MTCENIERQHGPHRHACNPPGWWRRWRCGIRPGVFWRCPACRTLWLRGYEPWSSITCWYKLKEEK